MTATRTISYDVHHISGYVFDPAQDALADLIGERPALFVVDENLWANHGARLQAYARARLDGASILRVPSDEANKTLAAVELICAVADRRCLPRDGVMMAIGGGVILDTVGLAASMYRRGVPYGRVPTTLVGLIDVGVGVKQAVNFNGKNKLGAFYPPIGTINDRTFLASLPPRHLSCGLAEIIKMAIVCDRVLFHLVERHGAALLRTAFTAPQDVADEVLIRAEMSMMDELSGNLFEHDLRRLVDFGHTFSPALETATSYVVHHGEAVALDMLISTSLGIGRGLCSPALLRRLLHLYDSLALPTAHDLLTTELLGRAMVNARAHRAGTLNLVVPTGAGAATFVQDVSDGELRAGLGRLDTVRRSCAERQARS